jgi:hypothetical protein
VNAEVSESANFSDIHRLNLACRNLPYVHAQPEAANDRFATFGLLRVMQSKLRIATSKVDAAVAVSEIPNSPIRQPEAR